MMADRIKESEQNGVKTWVNSQWILFFTNLEELLSAYEQKKFNKWHCFKESLSISLESAVQALQNLTVFV